MANDDSNIHIVPKWESDGKFPIHCKTQSNFGMCGTGQIAGREMTTLRSIMDIHVVKENRIG